MCCRFVRYILPAFLLFAPTLLQSQEYFQQGVDYTIEVKLNDQQHTLNGFETIQYTNNSPEELEHLYFHLWPNAYKNNQTALAREQFQKLGKHQLFRVESQRGFIDSLNFKVNNESVSWEYNPKHQDICRLILNKPLGTGETITITTPFRVKIPLAVTSRMGHTDQSYKITQWYPKPAVYDSHGWHPIPYLDQGEFYSEFGSFDVSITLPDNYVVAATGNLQNPSEIQWIKKRIKETKRTYHFDEFDNKQPESGKNLKTLRYTINNVHDFAWFANKRFHILKDSVKLPDSGKTVYIFTYFTNEQADLWQNATDYIKNALTFYSDWFGPYPYENCTAVSGIIGSTGNNMEYPGITVLGHAENSIQLEELIAHEVAHNWFYGMLGFNERRHPFLDEGLTTLAEMRYMNKRNNNKIKLYQSYGFEKGLAGFLGIHFMNYGYLNEFLYLLQARKNEDQPTNTSSNEFSTSNYNAISYGKSSRAFYHLLRYLGESQFDSIMSGFTAQWKFKHPSPDDLRQHFKNATDKNLDWFFNGLITTDKKIDYKIKNLENNKLLVKNKGSIAAPLVLKGLKNGNTIFSKWEKGFHGEKQINLPESGAELIAIDPEKNMLELYRHNNYIKTKGFFKKTEPLKLQLGGLFNNPEYTQVHFLPVPAWNYYDKTMLGLLLYDAPLPPDKFDYYLAPAYSTGNNTFAGTGKVSFRFFPEQLFNSLELNFSGKRYSISDVYEGQYEKMKAEAVMHFSGKNSKYPAETQLKANVVHATAIEDIEDRILNNTNDPLSKSNFLNFSFVHANKKSINPYLVSASLQTSKSFTKMWFKGDYKFSYYMDEGLSVRLFGGTFISKTKDLPWNYAFHLSGENGFQDYMYSRTYFGRFEPPQFENAIRILTQQFYPTDGAFVLYSPLGVTKDWLVSLNLKTSLPLIRDIPIHAYANLGMFRGAKESAVPLSNNKWAYETGFKLSFLNLIDVYFPAIASGNLEKASNYISGRYGEKIRFHFRFNLLEPKSLMENLTF